MWQQLILFSGLSLATAGRPFGTSDSTILAVVLVLAIESAIVVKMVTLRCWFLLLRWLVDYFNSGARLSNLVLS